jgi:hypothetical protein
MNNFEIGEACHWEGFFLFLFFESSMERWLMATGSAH